jgi:hypothetical protein
MVRPTASLDHETATSKRPHSDRRPTTATNGLRELGDVDVGAMKRRDRACHRQRELRPRTKAGVPRQSAMYPDSSSLLDSVVAHEAASKLLSTLAIVAFNVQAPGGARGHERRWCRSRGADSAEPAPALAAKIEHAEMQPGRRLDELMASSSRGPAVLSTITCSRASSLSMNARDNIWSRVA